MLSTLSTSSADCASARLNDTAARLNCAIGALPGAFGVEGSGGERR